jgi:SurA N-terminal domain
MDSVSSRTRRIRAAITGVAAVLALAAGCANAEPGVVAYVGPTEITEGQLDDSVEAISETLEAGQTVSREAVVNALIHGALAEQVAAANQITVSDAERDQMIKNTELAPLLDVPAARPIAYDVADQQIVAEKLGAEAYLKAVSEHLVTLNPRFGVLDSTRKLIVPDQSGSLAKPASPTPEPNP